MSKENICYNATSDEIDLTILRRYGNYYISLLLVLLLPTPTRLCRSTWVERSRPSVCLFVCLFVRSITKNEWSQSVQTWYREPSWDTLEVVLFSDSEVKGQGHRVNNSTLHTRTAINRHSLGGVNSRRRGIELGIECLIVIIIIIIIRTKPVEHNEVMHAVTQV